jgi:hypothetical protein
MLGLSLMLSACTYQGMLREDFYRLGAGADQKYPYKVAVFVDDHAKSVSLDIGDVHVDLDMYVAMEKAIQQSLQVIFERVTVIREKSNLGEYDVLASAGIDLAYIPAGRIGGNQQQLEVKAELTLKDLRGGVILARESPSKKITWTVPGKFKTCSALTGLSLMLLSPITIPCATNALGEEVMAALEKELPGVIRNIAADVQSDGRFAAYVKGGSGGQAVASAPVARPIPTSDVDAVITTVSPRKRPAYAVVVGIEQYRQGLPKADFSDHDARIVRDHLVKGLGYQEENVVLLMNDRATKTDLEKYFEKWLENRVDQGDSVFVYFSGHGAPNPKTGDAYLVPYDGDPAYIDTTGYSLKRLYDSLAKLPAREVVVLLDSCFSGAGGRSVLAKGARPMGLSVEKAMVTGGKTVVMAASSGDQISSTYTTKSHGLMTYFFLKGLQGEGDQNKDGVLDIKELFDYLKPQVERIARREYNNEQTPQLLGNRDLLAKGVPLTGRTR